jgi:uncharacterized delta-60 repeat protein
MAIRIGLLVVALVAIGEARAGGWLDRSFGVNGEITVGIGSTSADEASAVSLDAAGNVYVAGWSDAPGYAVYTVLKVDARGVPDPAFGESGIALADLPTGDYHYVRGLAIGADGSVLVSGGDNVSGPSEMSIVKFTPSGQLDSSWGDGGRVLIEAAPHANEYINAMTFDEDGRLYVIGATFIYEAGLVFKIAALNASGRADATFGDGGVALIAFEGASASANAVLRDASGDFYVGGYSETAAGEDMALVKLDASGQLVRAFGIDGKVIVDVAQIDAIVAMSRDAVGNFYLGGWTSLAKLDALGNPVTEFGTLGKLDLTELNPGIEGVYGISVDTLGDVYVSGTGTPDGEHVDFFIMQLDPRGRPGLGFGQNGVMYIEFPAAEGEAFASTSKGDGVFLVGRVSGGAPNPENVDFGIAKVLVSPPSRALHSTHQRPVHVANASQLVR